MELYIDKAQEGSFTQYVSTTPKTHLEETLDRAHVDNSKQIIVGIEACASILQLPDFVSAPQKNNLNTEIIGTYKDIPVFVCKNVDLIRPDEIIVIYKGS